MHKITNYDIDYFYRVQNAKIKGLDALLSQLKPSDANALRIYNEIVSGTNIIELNSKFQQITGDGYSIWQFKGYSMSEYGYNYNDIVLVEESEYQRDSYNSCVLVEYKEMTLFKYWDGYSLSCDKSYPEMRANSNELKQIGIPICKMEITNDIFNMSQQQRINRYFIERHKDNKLIDNVKFKLK